jgi:SpoIID/LytB domain protein
MIGGRLIACSHPRIGRPLSPVEALAYSCNSFFGTIARRLSPDGFDRALLRLGLAPAPRSGELIEAVIGIRGTPVPPRSLVDALLRVSRPDGAPTQARGRALLLEGLAAAATFGTAASFRSRGISALAKTGTAPMPGGGYQGVVAAVAPWPDPEVGLVLIAPGAAGTSAAELGAELLESHGLSAPRIRVRTGNGVRRLALDEYVAETVAGEASSTMPAAALEALAITARTYALANPGRHAGEGFDFCELTHCQVVRPATAASRSAALATSGRVLTIDGRTAQVFYTASCGGRLEAASAAWRALGSTREAQVMTARPDPAGGGEAEWTADLRADVVEASLHDAGYRGSVLRDMRVTARTASGRVAVLRIDGLTPPEISGEDFRLAVGRHAGWQFVRSTSFDLVRTPAGYRLTGRGRGHGVGLCLTGAARLGKSGSTADEILQQYFPGMAVRPTTRLTLMLPSHDEHAHGELERLTRELLSSLSAAARVPVPARIDLRVYPTVEEYQRATGRPWWTAGTTRAHEIHLVPLEPLRQRRRLVPVLRHELAHVLLDARLRDRPLWAREGAAMHFAGEASRPGQPGTPCPDDRQILAAADAGILRNAYDAPSACFERALAAGQTWQEVGAQRSD